jgi:hypothetical protein
MRLVSHVDSKNESAFVKPLLEPGIGSEMSAQEMRASDARACTYWCCQTLLIA